MALPLLLNPAQNRGFCAEFAGFGTAFLSKGHAPSYRYDPITWAIRPAAHIPNAHSSPRQVTTCLGDDSRASDPRARCPCYALLSTWRLWPQHAPSGSRPQSTNPARRWDACKHRDGNGGAACALLGTAIRRYPGARVRYGRSRGRDEVVGNPPGSSDVRFHAGRSSGRVRPATSHESSRPHSGVGLVESSVADRTVL